MDVTREEIETIKRNLRNMALNQGRQLGRPLVDVLETMRRLLIEIQDDLANDKSRRP